MNSRSLTPWPQASVRPANSLRSLNMKPVGENAPQPGILLRNAWRMALRIATPSRAVLNKLISARWRSSLASGIERYFRLRVWKSWIHALRGCFFSLSGCWEVQRVSDVSGSCAFEAHSRSFELVPWVAFRISGTGNVLRTNEQPRLLDFFC